MTAPAGRGLMRVLVGLDAASARGAMLGDAVLLAARLGAELEGLFVEDIDVLRAAGLPAAAELSLTSGVFRSLDRRAVEAQLTAIAVDAREALVAKAGTHRLTCTFRVARGHPANELLVAAERVDFVVLGRVARGFGAGDAAKGPVHVVATRARASVLVLGTPGHVGRAHVVVYDGTPSGDRALELAARLAGSDAGLTVLVSATTPDRADRLAQHAIGKLPRGPTVAIRRLGDASPASLAHASRAPGALLVIAADSPVLARGGLEQLLGDVETTLLLTR